MPFFLYVYIYTLFILVIIINVRCVALFATSLVLPFASAIACVLILPRALLYSLSFSLCLSTSLARSFFSLYCFVLFEVSFRFLLVFSFFASPYVSFSFNSTQFNYFKVTRKSTSSQLYAVVEVKRFIRFLTHTLFSFWCARKDNFVCSI